MPTEKRYEINELTDTESTADAGNMLNGKAVVDEPTVTEFTEIESMDEIIKLPAVYRHYKKYNWVTKISK